MKGDYTNSQIQKHHVDARKGTGWLRAQGFGSMLAIIPYISNYGHWVIGVRNDNGALARLLTLTAQNFLVPIRVIRP